MLRRANNGSVVLVALSCVTVLGIAVASFLSVSNQAMKLSNRNYAKSVSKQLAEIGLERALRSYNGNTFGSGWTLAGGTTATRNFAISSSRYGNSGITANVKIRVERYRAANKATVWGERTAYAANDYVWYHGVWYVCTAAPPVSTRPGQPVSESAFWKAAPETWNAHATYWPGNIALFGGSAYLCTLENSNRTPPNTTYWTAYSVARWSSSTVYAVDTVALSGGIAYRCIAAHTDQAPPNTAYWLSAPVIYAEGVATLPDSGSTQLKTQIRATLAPAPLFPNAIGATTLVTFAGNGTVNSYNSVLGAHSLTTTPFSLTSPNLGSSAVVAGGNTGGTAVAITNVRVNGYLAAPSSTTSPHAPQYTNSTSGIVTSVAAPTIPATKIDFARISRSPYIPHFDIQTVTGAINLPAPSSGSTLADGDLAGATNLGVAGAVRVYTVTRSMTGGSFYSGLYLAEAADVINISGHVILNVTGSYFGMGSGKIVILAGGSLEIYFSASTQMYFGTFGTGGIDNSVSKDPSKLFIASNHATNTLNYHYLQSTVLPFYGTFYMPNAYLTVASNNIPIFGALSAKNVNFTSVVNFRYDTSLRTDGAIGTYVDSPYRLVEWRELTDPAEKITLP
jgi:hypothetical protein